MTTAIIFLFVIIVLAWTYDFYNGMNDCANAIATTISTRALSPRMAILLAAGLNIAGAFLTTAVAKTIGKGIVAPEAIDQWIFLSALLGAIIWSAICTHAGIPISITHSLVGGLIGAAVAGRGMDVVQWTGIRKVLIAMILSPLAGFLAGTLLMIAMVWIGRNAHPFKANRFFLRSQILSASFMALSHGANDTQNAMGVITAALVSGGFLDTFHVPYWVMLGSGAFMGLGTYLGGWKVIKTMGMRMVKLRPLHGFSAETSATASILAATYMGAPISTTQVISTAIMGVGAAEKLSRVKWGLSFQIIATWILTIPGAALISAILCILIELIGLSR
ncbi:MAG: inorganic phosphate transporter [Acidobacteriota bacterium]